MGCGMLNGSDAERMYMPEDFSQGYHVVTNVVQDPRLCQVGDFMTGHHVAQDPRLIAAQAGDFGPAQMAVQDPRLMAARAEDFGPGQNGIQDLRLLAPRAEDFSPGHHAVQDVRLMAARAEDLSPAKPDPRLMAFQQGGAEQVTMRGGAPGLPPPGSFFPPASYADDSVIRASPSAAPTATVPPAPPSVPPGNLQLPLQKLPEDIVAPPRSPPSMALLSPPSNPVIKEITLQDANNDLMDKFMKKFDF